MSAVGTAGRTNTIVPPPTGIQNGDLLVLLFYVEIDGAAPPAGFVPFTNLGPLPFPVHDTNFWAWRKKAQGESGGYTITHGNAFTNAVMLVYRNVDPDSPEDVLPSTNSGNANPNMVANGVTVLTPGSVVIYAAGMWNVPPLDLNPPGGSTPVFTERWDPNQSDNDWGLHVCDGVMTVAGATGNKTVFDGPSLDDWVTTLITLRAFSPLAIDDREIEGASWEDDRTIETANWEDDRTFDLG